MVSSTRTGYPRIVGRFQFFSVEGPPPSCAYMGRHVDGVNNERQRGSRYRKCYEQCSGILQYRTMKCYLYKNTTVGHSEMNLTYILKCLFFCPVLSCPTVYSTALSTVVSVACGVHHVNAFQMQKKYDNERCPRWQRAIYCIAYKLVRSIPIY